MSAITDLAQVVDEQTKKAIIVSGELANGGKLPPEQADEFLNYVIDVTLLRNNVRIVRFRQESMQLDKIGVGNRVTVPKEEAQDPQIRAGVSTSKVTITPKNLMTPFEISDDFADQCIEGETVEETITRLMATQTGNDIEELLINGDVLGPARYQADLPGGGSSTQVVKDTYMALFNGWLRLADSGTVRDFEGDDISTIFFGAMIRSMPIKYRRVRMNLRFLLSLDHEQLYREKIGARQTAAGDAANTSQTPLNAFGVPIIGVPLMDSEPRIVEHITFAAAPDTQSLTYGPISSGNDLFITSSTLDSTPVTPLTEGAANDYTVVRTSSPATITSVAGGSMNAGGSYKVTYHAQGMALLCDYMNLIMAIGRDITFETQRQIYRSVNQFAITTRVGAQVEETTAVVKGINIGLE